MLCYLALGSNLGDRAGYLLEALARISLLPGTRLARLSSVYETRPVGPAGQGPYLNMVAELETGLGAEELMPRLLEIEGSLGRIREKRWGPRTIDLDLLLYGDTVLKSELLNLPHPEMHQRAFVLAPLCDLIPKGVHPLLNETYDELLQRLDRSGVAPLFTASVPRG